MKLRNPGILGLQVQLALAQFGWTTCIAAILCLVGITALLWGIPQLHSQIETQRQSLSSAKQMLKLSRDAAAVVVPGTRTEQRASAFYNALGESKYAEEQIKTLFSLAAKTGLSLDQGEYKSAVDPNGGYETYQIVLPVKGSYSAIRKFCQLTLAAIPFASLDEMNFKRDAIGNQTLEAKLHFTLYLAAPTANLGDSTQ